MAEHTRTQNTEYTASVMYCKYDQGCRDNCNNERDSMLYRNYRHAHKQIIYWLNASQLQDRH
jgi:hypothetical protein